MKFKKYKKSFDYSYTSGFFPTIELLTHKPEAVESVFYSSNAEQSNKFSEVSRICQEQNTPFIESKKQVDLISEKENTFITAVFDKYKMELKEMQNHLLLFNPSDMGNMGTINRTALGFGIGNIAIISPGVDIYNPKVIRASMGAIFQTNIEYFDSMEDYRKKYDNKLYIFDIKGKNALSGISPHKPYTLVFGNEGSGVPDEILGVGEVVALKHSDKIDSLNLSTSVGVVLHSVYNSS